MKTLLRLDKLALERPDDVALLEHGVTTSFLQLANASRALASFYISQGIPQGSVVACLKNTMTGTFIAALAGLRAGVGFIILDCQSQSKKGPCSGVKRGHFGWRFAALWCECLSSS